MSTNHIENMVDLKIEEQLKGIKKRDLSQTYFYKMACRAFGPAKRRNRVIIAQPMRRLNSIQVPSKQMTSSKNRSVPVVAPGLGDRDHHGALLTTMLLGKDVANHRDWVEQRRVFRKELDNIGNLSKWLHAKPTVTELEMLVVEREKNTEKTTSPKVWSSFVYIPR